jgi:hypothetical protein
VDEKARRTFGKAIIHLEVSHRDITVGGQWLAGSRQKAGSVFVQADFSI